MALLLAQAKWLAGFLAFVGVALFSYHGLVPGGAYELYVPMADAAGLFPGSDVLIAGSRAGTVSDLKLANGGSVVVHINLDPAHSPVRSNATVTLRPKSLLGEKYLDLQPGSSGYSLASGAKIPASRVNISTDLDQVINTFDQPTREKLQTVVIEVGGGLAGRGADTNETFRYGTKDLNDLATIANTLKQRDADLQRIIPALDDVLTKLTTSSKRQQIGELIQNTEKLLATLVAQDAELKRMLAQTNAALARTGVALDGTSGALYDVIHAAPTLVRRTDLLTGHLSTVSDSVLTMMPTTLRGIHETAIVFGGKDANGYATRISVLAGGSSPGIGPSGQVPTDGARADAAGNPVDSTDVYRFLLGDAYQRSAG